MTVSISNMSQVWMSNTNTYNAIAMSVSTMDYGANANSRLLLFKVDGNTKFSVDANGNIFGNTLTVNTIITVSGLNYLPNTSGASFNGNLNFPTGNLVVGKTIVPSVGSTSDTGIRWPIDPGGGAGDAAFLNYYVIGGETTKFVIGTNNDADDTLVLYQFGADRVTLYNGNVGINTSTPSYKLDVNGSANVSGSLTVQGTGYVAGSLTTGGLTVNGDIYGNTIISNRVDSSSEGGQLTLRRASDNLDMYGVDVAGTGTTPNFRIINVNAGAELVTVNPSGDVTVKSNTLNLGISSLGTNGYTRLPNGLLLQWGTSGAIGQDSSGTVTFPRAFTTLYCITITGRQAINTGSGGSDTISASNTTTFTIAHGADGTSSFYWMAIGI